MPVADCHYSYDLQGWDASIRAYWLFGGRKFTSIGHHTAQSLARTAARSMAPCSKMPTATDAIQSGRRLEAGVGHRRKAGESTSLSWCRCT
mmetsp:Transcript_84860/g.117169  ORF Transcript_84860/g.117169 Transcript_84860/m.117169 type:complete len:91 (-) Transcript_84860:1-273(-)